ncbi:MAG: YqiJ family protein [Proteobacteria bacterium]|nr:YqiJ family protein [Cystobacterineae bacterium]MCL2258517.1 YqiJ family protein [Cystobacterineae bacterium]MCL2315254.1 YqiJ family protein [Pseudomonadota bacterium]
MSLFLAQQSLPFTIALIVMLVLTVLEGASLLVGGSGLSEMLDNVIDFDMDADAGIHGHGGLLGWLHFGRVPVLMLLILFLTSFGIAGLLIQMLANSIVGNFLPSWLASIGAFFASVPAVRAGGFMLEKILPKDESSAISLDALVGRAGIIVIGTARMGAAAQARVRDEHGRSHYVMVEPDNENSVFETGTEILLVKRLGAKYQAIRNPHAGLMQP